MVPPVSMGILELAQVDRYRVALRKNHTAGPDNISIGNIGDNLFLHGLLELEEDVDEDAWDADDTSTDDFRLIACSNPKWHDELAKHLMRSMEKG